MATWVDPPTTVSRLDDQSLLSAKQDPSLRAKFLSGITESKGGYNWAEAFPEDRMLVRHLVTRDPWVQKWAQLFPQDLEIMRLLIKPRDALEWARAFPADKGNVRNLIACVGDARDWVELFPKDLEYMEGKFPNLDYYNYIEWDRKADEFGHGYVSLEAYLVLKKAGVEPF